MTLNEFYNRLCYTFDRPARVKPDRWKAMLEWHRRRCSEGLTPAAYLSMMEECEERQYLDYIGEY